MENVKLDNFGSGWQWHGSSRGKRGQFRSCRDSAIKEFGQSAVETAESIAPIPDVYVLAYVAEKFRVRHLFGVGLSGWSLLSTPGIKADRYRRYRNASKKHGLKQFANLPPNYELAIAGNLKRLSECGQLGLGPEDVPTAQYPLCQFS